MDRFGNEQMLNARVIGASPLGNNSVEGTAPGHASVDDATPRDVPLVYDSISGTWVAKLSRVNQEDRNVDIDKAKAAMDDQRFLSSVGFQTK
jgi:hypothetical protein